MEKITAERVLAELAEIAFADLGAEPAPPVKVGDKLRALELIYKYLGLGDVDKDGMRTVIFELNGIRREVQVPDEAAQKNIVKVPMADPEDKSQVGASIPGAVSKIAVKAGDRVEKNQTLVTIEAMKMETAITARMDGTVDTVEVKEGVTVKGGQLLLTIK